MSRGWYVVVEGTEGAGKSTLMRALADRLRAYGEVVAVRQPGGTPVAEHARTGALDPDLDASPEAELFFILAARADLVTKVIQPALSRGAYVLCDRSEMSTLAYQVAGRGLDHNAVAIANRLATGGVVPDLTLILDVPVEVGRARMRAAGKALDRMEQEDPGWHARVVEAFRSFQGPDIVHLDGTATPEHVSAAAWATVQDRLSLGEG